MVDLHKSLLKMDARLLESKKQEDTVHLREKECMVKEKRCIEIAGENRNLVTEN